MEEMKVDFETFKEEIRGDIEKALYERIGGRLKALRLKQGLSQKQLADELSFGSKSMVSQYESNKRAITIDALLEYSNRFNVTTD